MAIGSLPMALCFIGMATNLHRLELSHTLQVSYFFCPAFWMNINNEARQNDEPEIITQNLSLSPRIGRKPLLTWVPGSKRRIPTLFPGY